ncbi:MAG: peptigoglycan-binding protein LysM [Kaistia sp. SCN 65-12]|nr:MAG: peptigoglycan-binding protein LysM [Kaistia sp. SCN 65-12]
MQLSVLKANRRNLARGCAVLMVAGFAAGCSSQVARFGDGLDSVATASTDNQRSIIGQQNAAQPYPGDSVYTAPVGVSQTPVSRSSLPPPASAQPAPAAAPTVAQASPSVDRTVTGTVQKPFQAAEAQAPKLSDNQPSRKATEVVVESGQTLSGLSRRYGVPADAIMKVNGLADANDLKAGSKIVIPAYGYSVKGGAAVAGNPVSGSQNLAAGAPAAQKVALASPSAEKPKPQQAAAAETNDPFIVSKGTAAKAKAAAPGTYTVQSGDTLSAISRKTGVSTAALKKANGMDGDVVRIGQTLTVPSGNAPAATVAAAKPAAVDPVKTASTPAAAKATPTETVAAYTPPKKEQKVIQQAEDDGAVAPSSTGIGKMRWPVRGRVISGFGGKGGDGIDISVPEGTPIKAAENGVVIYAGDGLKEFGNTVLVRHEDGLVTVYGHASSLQVTRGQKVKRGQEIALSGMSGTTDAPKLHFEVRKNSAPVDPKSFLE